MVDRIHKFEFLIVSIILGIIIVVSAVTMGSTIKKYNPPAGTFSNIEEAEKYIKVVARNIRNFHTNVDTDAPIEIAVNNQTYRTIKNINLTIIFVFLETQLGFNNDEITHEVKVPLEIDVVEPRGRVSVTVTAQKPAIAANSVYDNFEITLFEGEAV